MPLPDATHPEYPCAHCTWRSDVRRLATGDDFTFTWRPACRANRARHKFRLRPSLEGRLYAGFHYVTFHQSSVLIWTNGAAASNPRLSGPVAPTDHARRRLRRSRCEALGAHLSIPSVYRRFSTSAAHFIRSGARRRQRSRLAKDRGAGLRNVLNSILIRHQHILVAFPSLKGDPLPRSYRKMWSKVQLSFHATVFCGSVPNSDARMSRLEHDSTSMKVSDL